MAEVLSSRSLSIWAVRLTIVALAGAALSACATAPAPKPTTSAELFPVEAAKPSRDGKPAGDQSRSLYGLFLAGLSALDQGSSREAADYLGRASALAPETPMLREQAFKAAIMAGDIEKAAASAPGPGEGANVATERLGRITRAVEALSNNRGREAQSLLSGDAMPAPYGTAAALLKPWAAASAADWDVALAEPAPGADRAMNTLFAAYGRAQLLEISGRTDKAEAAYKALVDRQGVFAASYGNFLERRGRRADALAFYDGLLAKRQDVELRSARDRVAANKPAPPLPTFREGAAQALIGPAAQLMGQRQADIGLAYLRLALRLDPKLDEAWVLVGDSMNAGGDVVAAREAYRRVGPASTEYSTARGRLAWSLQNEKDPEGALKMARETIQALPNSLQALADYADLLRANERFGETVDVLSEVIKKSAPAPGWRLYYLRGMMNERAGRWDAAEADLVQALKLNPNSPDALNYLGFGWANRNLHIKQATEMLQKAAALRPRDGAIIDSLGWARYRAGDYTQAVRDLEQAVLLVPSDPDVNDHLGDAYWRVNRKLEAEYQWRRVLTLQPDDATKTSIEGKLRSGLPPAPIPRGNEVSARLEAPSETAIR